MFLASGWKDYEVIDTCGGEKLERWGKYILLRPDPQVIWNTKKLAPEWKKLNAHYHRSVKGGGEWEFFSLPEQWQIHYDLKGLSDGRLTFNLKPFSFKHTGLFDLVETICTASLCFAYCKAAQHNNNQYKR